MKKLFYFAFGSNMLEFRLRYRVGKVKHAGTHVLNGFKLCFNCGHMHNSYANIVADKKSSVEGVLYELSEYQVAELDKYEGYPFNYEKRYFILPDGNIGFAYVSVNPRFTSTALPDLDYLNILIEGAFENKLFKTYNELVLFKMEHYHLKKGCKHKLVQL